MAKKKMEGSAVPGSGMKGVCNDKPRQSENESGKTDVDPKFISNLRLSLVIFGN